jgi:hypothetical protein
MITEPLDIAEDVDAVEDAELLPVEFKSTGNMARDRGIIGIMVDSPLLVKALNKAKKWDSVCASVNPMGEAEKFAVQNSGIAVADEAVIPVLKRVKTLLQGGTKNVAQAFQKSMLEPQIKRIDIGRLMSVVKLNVVGGCKLVGNVLTSPDGQTYEFGTRGKPARWVSEWKAANKAD